MIETSVTFHLLMALGVSSRRDPSAIRTSVPAFRETLAREQAIRSHITGIGLLQHHCWHSVLPAGAGLNYEFSSSSAKGAILVLPGGAEKRDLRNDLAFRQEVIQNTESWYQFAYFRLGYTMINNDSLYLITGCHKASSWSAAAFAEAAGDTSLAAQFVAGEVINGNVAGAYSWQVANSVHWRVGPEEEQAESNSLHTRLQGCH